MIRVPMLVLLFVLVACGGSPSAPRTAQQVVDALKAGGLEISDVKPGERAEGTPLPNSYKENLTFSIAEVAPSGGQVFVCDTKQNCDALYAYFDAMKALGGPYYYRSPDGLAVAQLNSGLSADTGAKAKTAMDGLK